MKVENPFVGPQSRKLETADVNILSRGCRAECLNCQQIAKRVIRENVHA